MAPELSLETMGEKLLSLETNMDKLMKVANEMKENKDAKKAESEEEKNKEAKKAKMAEYEKDMKEAMEEKDMDKKEAMIKTANEKLNDEHKAETKDDKHEASEEEKEHNAAVKDLILNEKTDLINKIKNANVILNPTKIQEVEARIKNASLTQLKEEWGHIEPFVAQFMPTNSQPTPQAPTYVIPPMLNTVSQPDQFQAGTNDNLAGKSTAELLEMYQ